MFLNQLRKGQTISGACAHAGFSRTSFYDAINADPTSDLTLQVERARGEGERRLVEAVTTAAHTGDTVTTPGGQITVKPGDWRAAAWLLEHHPATREKFAAIQKQQLSGDPDNPVPIKTANMHVVGDYDMLERNARIVALMQQAGVLPIPDGSGGVIDHEEERNGDGG